MMGIPATDGRLIRPAGSPSSAKISFDWQKVLSEATQRSPAIREARFRVKQRELELNAADKYVVPADQKNVSLAIQKRKVSIANVNLALACERVKLAESEKDAVSQLSSAVSSMDAAYISSVSNFNRRAAAKRQIEAVEAAYSHGLNGVTFSDLLNAQQRLATAESDYYRSLTNYAKAMSQFQFRKGTLLDYDGIELAERSDQHARPEPAKQSEINPAGKTTSTKDVNQIAFAGLCHDEQGLPVTGVRVSLFLTDGELRTTERLQSVNADDAGGFRFAAISGPSPSDDDLKHYWIGASMKGWAAVEVNLYAKHWRGHDQLDIVMPEAASFRGKVTGPDGRPVEGAKVWATKTPSPVEGIHAAVTDGEGRFEISDLEKRDGKPVPVPGYPGAFSQINPGLHVRHTGHVDALASCRQVPGTVDVTLQAAAAIEGHLLYGDSNKPAAGVPMFAQPIREERELRLNGLAVTDSNGHYRFNSIAAGKYNVIVSPQSRIHDGGPGVD